MPKKKSSNFGDKKAAPFGPGGKRDPNSKKTATGKDKKSSKKGDS